MPIELPERVDCTPYSAIESDDGTTFLCCGANDGTTRTEDQDCYRVCCKSETIDSMHDVDERDLVHQAAVIAGALAVIHA